MSGYVLVIADESRLHPIISLFHDQETRRTPLPGDLTLLHVSDSAAVRATSIFQGYAIDHDQETMVFAGSDDDHLPDPARPVEGSYFTARITDSHIRCGADSYGFVPMVWFSEAGITAVSDSYLSLIAIRRALGLPRTPHVETIRGRMWLNSMSMQQLGRETYCAEIRCATPGTELRFDLRSGTLEELPCDLRAFYTGAFESHAEAIAESTTRMVRTFKTYAEAGGLVTLGMSGGTDSRVCLAAALAADIGDALHISCTNNATRAHDVKDYAVAVALSEEFSFPLNRSNSLINGTLRENDVLAGWAATSMGVYDALYSPAKFRRRKVPVFAVGGQGAEISKGNFGWRQLSSITMPPESLDQCHRVLEAIGIGRDDRWGSEWHYIAFRNALHGGRGILSSDYIARPAAQIPLIGLSRSPLNELPAPRKNAPSVIVDTLIKLNPELALRPFDNPQKDISHAYATERLERLGGPLEVDSLTAYRTFGTPVPPWGMLSSQLELAREAGFTGSLDARTLVPLIEAPMEEFSTLISDDVRERILGLSPTSVARVPASSREGGALGKLLALTTLL